MYRSNLQNIGQILFKMSHFIREYSGSQTRGRDPFEGRQKSEKGHQLLKKEDFLKNLI